MPEEGSAIMLGRALRFKEKGPTIQIYGWMTGYGDLAKASPSDRQSPRRRPTANKRNRYDLVWT